MHGTRWIITLRSGDVVIVNNVTKASVLGESLMLHSNIGVWRDMERTKFFFMSYIVSMVAVPQDYVSHVFVEKVREIEDEFDYEPDPHEEEWDDCLMKEATQNWLDRQV